MLQSNLPKRPRVPSWPVTGLKIPVAVLEPGCDLLAPRYQSFEVGELSLFDSIRFSDADQIKYGKICKLKHNTFYYVLEVQEFIPAPENIRVDPRELVLKQNSFFDVSFDCVLDKIEILPKNYFESQYPAYWNVERQAEPPAIFQKQHVAPNETTFFYEKCVRANGSIYTPRGKAITMPKLGSASQLSFYQNKIRAKVSKVHSARYPAPRYVRKIALLNGTSMKTVGNLAYIHVPNMPSDIAESLLQGMPVSRRRGTRVTYTSKKSFGSLEDLQRLFGYTGIPWQARSHSQEVAGISSFVPANSLDKIEIQYDYCSKDFRFRFECLRRDENRILDHRMTDEALDADVSVSEYTVVLQDMHGAPLKEWANQSIPDGTTLSAARVEVLKLLSIPHEHVPVPVPNLVWHMRIEYAQIAEDAYTPVDLLDEAVLSVAEAYPDKMIRVRFNPANMEQSAESEKEHIFLLTPTQRISPRGGASTSPSLVVLPSHSGASARPSTSSGVRTRMSARAGNSPVEFLSL